MGKPVKILAIQTKSLGDALMMIPALQAIRRHFPDGELHALVPEAVAPLLQNQSCLTRLWTVPRVRGSASIKQNWPIIRALRAERFDRSVDFSSTDRSAILSFFCGARDRLGTLEPGGFLGRRFCFTRRLVSADIEQHEAFRLLHILSAWGIAPPTSVDIQIHADPALDAAAAKIIPTQTVVCHIGSSIPKKEWPVAHWAALHRLAVDAGQKLIFSTGASAREQALLHELKTLAPAAARLPPGLSLATFLAVINRAEACVSNDTGPMHFAAGLGVPTIGLFGATHAIRWRPVGAQNQVVQSAPCHCAGAAHNCYAAKHCMADIAPEVVFQYLQTIVAAKKTC